MRKSILLVVSVFISLISLADGLSVVLQKTTYNSETIYEGTLSIAEIETLTNAEFIPAVGEFYQVQYENVTTDYFIGELSANIVDVSGLTAPRLELASKYQILSSTMMPGEHRNMSANFPIERVAGGVMDAYTRMGDYRIVFQARKEIPGVEAITLTFSDATFEPDYSVRAVFLGQPASAYSIQVGETTDLESMISFHYLSKENEGKYVVAQGVNENETFDIYAPYWESSDETVATVDSRTGVVTGVAPGTATITSYRYLEAMADVEADGVFYPEGSALRLNLSHEVTVTKVPDLSVPWNSYGADFAGIGYDGESDNWQGTIPASKFQDALNNYEAGLADTWKPSFGDVFTVRFKGTASCSGHIQLALVDTREAVSWWAELSKFVDVIDVVEGEVFEFTVKIPIIAVQNAAGVDLTNPDLMISVDPTIGNFYGKENNVDIWLDEFEIGFIPATDFFVEIEQESPITLEVGESKELTLNLCPHLTGEGVWTSSYSNVAVVKNDEKALVNGVAVGTATITYTEYVTEDVYYSAEVAVNVEKEGEAPIPYVEKNRIEYCVGDQAESLVATGEGTIQWYVLNGNEEYQSIEVPVPSTVKSGMTTYYVGQTLDGMESVKVPVQVVVHDNPKIPTVDETEKVVCIGSQASFMATSTESVTWIDANYAFLTNDVVLSRTAMLEPQIFGVYATNSFGCRSLTKSVTLKSLPLPSVSVTGSTFLKINQEGSFEVTATSENSAIQSYSWYVDDTKLEETSALLTTTIPNIGDAFHSVTVYAFDESGCSASATHEVELDIANRSEKPVLTEEQKMYSVCQNVSAMTLTATPAENSELFWYDAAGVLLEDAPTPNTDNAGPIYYYVTQKTEGFEESEKVQVLVYVTAGPKIKMVAPRAVQPGAEVEISASAEITGSTFEWLCNGSDLTTETVDTDENTSSVSQTLTTIGDYVYVVTTTGADGCVGKASTTVTVTNTSFAAFNDDNYEIFVGESLKIEPLYLNIENLGNVRMSMQQNGEGFVELSVNEADGSCTVTGKIPGTGMVVLDFAYDDASYNQFHFYDTCYVTVNLNSDGSNFEFIPAEIEVETDASVDLQIRTTIPAHLYTVEWYSTDEGIASVTGGMDYYVFTGITEGTTQFTAKITVDGDVVKKTVNVKVKESAASKVGRPTVETTAYEYCVGDVAEQMWAIPDEDATLKWYDPYYQVLEDGPTPATDYEYELTYYVSQIKEGVEGFKVPITVSVHNFPALSLYTPAAVYKDSTVSFSASATTLCLYTWEVDGGITSEGLDYSHTITTSYSELNEAQIIEVTSFTEYCSDKKTATFRVKDAPSFVLDKHTAEVYLGDSLTLTPTLLNFNLAEDQKPSWETSDTAIAKIEDGLVTTFAEGEVVISYWIYYVDEETGYAKTYVDSCEITVSKPPVALPTVEQSAYSYCQGDVATQLSATADEEGTLNWYDSENTVLESAPIPSTETVGEISYFVSQTIGEIEGEKAKITITVHPNPEVTITDVPEYVMKDSSFVLPVSTTIEGDYLWTVNSNMTIPEKSPAFVFESAGIYDVELKLTTEYGCGDTSKTKVVVKEIPSVPVVGETEIVYCVGDAAAALSATATKTGAALTWYNVDGEAYEGTPVVSTDNVGVQTYFVAQTFDGLESKKIEFTVTVYPTPEVSILDVPEYVLKDSSFVLSASTTIEGDYLWTIGEDMTSSEKSPLLNFESAGRYNVEVKVTTENGCSDTSKAKVVVKEIPSVPTVGETEIVYCVGDVAAALSAKVTKTGASLTWYNAVGEAYEGTPVVSTDNIGVQTYFVAQTFDGLESEKTEFTITVYPTPEVSISDVPEYVLKDSSFVLSVSATIEGDYLWTINNVTTIPEKSPTFIFESVGTYDINVKLTTENGCVDTSSAKFIVKEMPLPPTVSETDFKYCKNDSPKELPTPTINVNATVNWYNSLDELVAEKPVVSTEVPGVLTYYVSQSFDGVESAKTKITVTVHDNPSVSFEPEVSTVYKGMDITMSANSENASEYVWLSGDTEFSKNNPATKKFYATGTSAISVFVVSDAGCVSDTVTVNYTVKNSPSVTFEKAAVSLYKGTTTMLTPQFANFVPTETPSWTSANPEIVSVENGVLTGKSEGTTTVTYSILYNDEETKIEKVYSATCSVRVRPDKPEIVCRESNYEMFVGEYFIVDAEVHATESQSYTIEISDTTLADVVDKMISATAPGLLYVYAISDEDKTLRDTMSILIKEFIPAKELSMPKQITIKVGRDTTLSATVVPFDASYKDVFFMEKEDDVIAVSADGIVSGKSPGTSIVTASTREGVQAQTMVYVTSSAEDIVKIQVPDTVFVKYGETITIPVKVSPTTIKANDLRWTVIDRSIAEVTSTGILTGLKIGGTLLYVSYGAKSNYVVVYVTKTVAPTVSHIPTVVMQQQGAPVVVDLSKYISCDTSLVQPSDLVIRASEDENIDVSISEMIATFSLKNPDYVGKTTIAISVADAEVLAGDTVEQVTTRIVDVEVDEKPNKAPVLVMDSVTVPYQKYVQIALADLAVDDYTPSSELVFKFSKGEKLLYKVMKNTYLRIYALEDDWSGIDTLMVSITDGDGETSQAEMVVNVLSDIVNLPPVILPIPTQYETDTTLFPNIELSQYVTDDYTSPSSIVWTASTSENVTVKITGSYAEISDLNENWRGAEIITFTAMDQAGLTSSYDVTFFRETTTTEEEKDFGWYGKPEVKIITSRYYGVPGETLTLIGTYYGTECSGLWQIEGQELAHPNDLIQYLVFDSTGYFDVTFIVQYGEKKDIIQKDEEMGIFGVVDRDPAICYGNEIELVATSDVDSYEWSTGETEKSIKVAPNKTTDYVLTMKKGLATLTDTITLRVSVPVALPKDSVMCAGTTYEVVSTGEDLYDSYLWNTGETTPSIVIPSEVAEYTVNTVIAMNDTLNCESNASFKILAVNELPKLDLGNDTTVCDKELLTLDAGDGFVYDWNYTKNDVQYSSDEQKIVLDSSAVVTVKITDNNMCESFDTLDVTFTYPYPEEIGVVTFSESSKNIIVAWERTADVNTDFYQVQCSLDKKNWNDVQSPINFNEASIVVDESANYEARSYFYRLETTDGCGNKAYSGVYTSSYLKPSMTVDKQFALTWWTYQSPRKDNVVGSYLICKKDENFLHPELDDELIPGYYVVQPFPTVGDYIGWTDADRVFQPGEVFRIAFVLDKEVDEKIIKDVDGNVVSEETQKSESGPFAIAISNIAEVEREDGIVDLFPADVVAYPTVVTDMINIAIASNVSENFMIELIDAEGRTVAETETGDIIRTLVQIPASGLKQGIYNVKVSLGGQSKTIQVIK